jgi:hypothetical protein
VQAEIAHVGRDKVLQERLAALVAKKNFVANEDICGAQLSASDL